MTTTWIFGGSKSLGVHLTDHFVQSHDVVSFSRSEVSSKNKNHRHVCVDFQNADLTHQVIAAEFAQARPSGAIFCQRFRPGAGLSDLATITAGLTVELGPVLALAAAAKRASEPRPISLVLLTSVAGLSTHIDIGLAYHILKSATLTATRFLAVDGGKHGLRANSIVLGEFEKYPRDSYTTQEQGKFNLIEQFTPIHRMSTMSHIADAIDFFLSEKSSNITGQSLSLDGHLSGVAPESILRQIAQV